MNARLVLLIFTAMFFAVPRAYPYTNAVGSLNSGGGISTNIIRRSTGVMGVFDDARSKSDANWSRVGTLVSFLLHPGLDFDGDGVPDEDDWDDDGDFLTDSDELTGTAFIPITASDPFNSDTDGDGAVDGDEAVAGTNPTNPASLFIIKNIEHNGNYVVVTWQGREGISYDLTVSDSLTPDNFTVISNIVATGGTGSWYETEVSITNIPSSLQLFYRVNIQK